MKRWLIAMATFALVAAACTAGDSTDTPSAVDTASGASHAPVTLEMWRRGLEAETRSSSTRSSTASTEAVPVDHGEQHR